MYRRVTIQHPPLCVARRADPLSIYGSMRSARFGEPRRWATGRTGRGTKRNETKRDRTGRNGTGWDRTGTGRDGTGQDRTKLGEARRGEARNKVRTDVTTLLRNNAGFKRFSGDRGSIYDPTVPPRHSPFLLSLSSLSAMLTGHNGTRRTPPTYTVFQRRETTNDCERDDNVSRTNRRIPPDSPFTLRTYPPSCPPF